MDFNDVIRRRKMVRSYTDEPIADDVLDRLLTAARRGPSAGFTQGVDFLVLTDAVDRRRFWALGDHWAAEETDRAPVVVVPLATRKAYLDRYAEPDKGWTDRDEARWPVPYWYIDAGMGIQNLLLAAVNEGLGALFFGLPRPMWGELRSEFGIPEDYDPIGAVTIGHPTDVDNIVTSARTRRRRPVEEVIHRGSW